MCDSVSALISKAVTTSRYRLVDISLLSYTIKSKVTCLTL